MSNKLSAPATVVLREGGQRIRLEAELVATQTRTTPTLVFLHEGLGCVRLWRDLPLDISFRLGLCGAVYSRQGYGGSSEVPMPRPLGYMHDEAKRLPEILDQLRITDSILIGHSDGASIALIAAGMGIVKPRAIVAIAPHVLVEDISVASIAKAADGYRTGDLRARLAKYHDDVDGAFWGWNRAWLDPEFKKWNIEEYLPTITCPLLVVQGEKDEYGTMEQVHRIERGVPGEVDVEIVPGAGHSPFRDDPERVHTRIVHFVRKVMGD